jgi:hypothetical protein
MCGARVQRLHIPAAFSAQVRVRMPQAVGARGAQAFGGAKCAGAPGLNRRTHGARTERDA